MAITKLKREFIAAKVEKNFSVTDVIPLVRRAWMNSFARVESNRYAIASRGWGPCNYALLEHPDILVTNETATTNATSTDAASFADLNYQAGFAGKSLSEILDNDMAVAELKDNIRKKRARAKADQSEQASLKKLLSKFTSGKLVAEGSQDEGQV